MRDLLALACLLVSAVLAVPAAAERRAVDAAEIRTAIEEAARDVTGEGTSVEVQQAPTLVTDGTGAPYHVEVALPDPPLTAGIRAIPVSCRTGGRVVSRGLATIVVKREVPVWVVARTVAPHTVLVPEDLRRETRVFDREPSREVLGDLEPGRFTTRHALAEGAVLKITDLARRPDVSSGDAIKLVARAGSATVAVVATARRSGNVGETILVANPLTGDVVEAVVIDSGTAELTRRPRTSRHAARPTLRGENP